MPVTLNLENFNHLQLKKLANFPNCYNWLIWKINILQLKKLINIFAQIIYKKMKK